METRSKFISYKMAGASKRRRTYESSVRKRMRSAVVTRTVPNSYAKFRRIGFHDTWNFSTASTSGFWRNYQPQLGTLSAGSEIADLFDLYRVNKVKIHLLPNYGGVQGSRETGSAGIAANNQFYIATGIQKGVIATPTGTYGNAGFNLFSQNYDNVRLQAFDKPITVTYTPRCSTTLSNGVGVAVRPWLSTTTLDQAQLGMGAFMFDHNFAGLNNGVFGCSVYVEMWLECKGNR